MMSSFKFNLASTSAYLYDWAKAIHQQGKLQTFYTGYPKFKLPDHKEFPVCSYSAIVAKNLAMIKYIPENFRPSNRDLYLSQDKAFDKRVAKNFTAAGFFIGMPGQCIKTFKRAKELGDKRILKHAMGSVKNLSEILSEEYEKRGLSLQKETPFNSSYLKQLNKEYALADAHIMASSIGKNQLIEEGVPEKSIWVIPYAANSDIFKASHSSPANSKPFSIVFAGQLSVRKGFIYLQQALEQAGQKNWACHAFGSQLNEVKQDLNSYTGKIPIKFHGAVNQAELAEAMRKADVLVLPSIEDGFGLVVPQALNCGTPCIVSDAVGAKDIITHRENGSIFPSKNSSELYDELLWWSENKKQVHSCTSWEHSARLLIKFSEELVK